MSVSEKRSLTTLVQHELALKVYIDALLEEEGGAPAVAVCEAEKGASAAPVLADAPLSASASGAPPEAAPAPQRSPYPPWAEAAFEALMFKIGGGLTLATPLVRLNTILTWSDSVTPMPGHAEWFLGLLPLRERQVKVIDIAKFVIPANHAARASLQGRRSFKHIIVVGSGEYGLACDGLGEVSVIDRDKVRWRSDRTRRPWLAGTVVEQMCALLDVDVFAEMLKDGCPADETGE